MKMTYQAFCDLATDSGLKDVTREEYNDHVKPNKKLSVLTLIRRIKNDRRGVITSGERQIIIGEALGSFDATYGKPIEKAREQSIVVLERGNKELQTYNWRGGWGGQHGRLIEFEADVGTRVAKSSGKEYEYRNMKKYDVHEDSANLSKIKWIDFYRIDDDDKYEMVAFKGEISSVLPKVIFEDNEPVDEWEIDQAKYPTCTITFTKGDVSVYASFGPYKNSEPLIKIDDWDLQSCPSIHDLHSNFAGAYVGIIGKVVSYNEKENDEGEEYTSISVVAAAIIDLESLRPEEEDEEEEEPAPRKRKSTTKEPAKVSKKDRGRKLIEEVRAGVQKGLEQAGDTITVADLKKGKFVKKAIPDDIIQTILDEELESLEEEEDEEEEEEEEEEEYSQSGKCACCGKKKKNISPRTACCEECDAESEDGEEEEEDDDDLEDEGDDEEDEDDEDESEDESDDEDDGEEEDEEEDESEDWEPETKLQGDIYDFLDGTWRETKQIKEKFLQKEYDGKKTTVRLLNQAIKSMVNEKVIERDEDGYQRT